MNNLVTSLNDSQTPESKVTGPNRWRSRLNLPHWYQYLFDNILVMQGMDEEE